MDSFLKEQRLQEINPVTVCSLNLDRSFNVMFHKGADFVSFMCKLKEIVFILILRLFSSVLVESWIVQRCESGFESRKLKSVMAGPVREGWSCN
jgi:hypothetical protein